MRRLKLLSMFSGILGLDKDAPKRGIDPVLFVERDEFCQKVIAKHHPDVPIHDDVTTLDADVLRGYGIEVCESTLLAEDSPAKTSVPQGKVPDNPARVLDSGGRCFEPFAWYDPSTRSWRTWQISLTEGWMRYSETWPRAGMIRNGIAYRREPLVPSTLGTEHFWLPTPSHRDGKGFYVIPPGQATQRQKDGRQLHLVHVLTLLLGWNERAWMNPRFTEMVMGFPKGWTSLRNSER